MGKRGAEGRVLHFSRKSIYVGMMNYICQMAVVVESG
jgi:hypothetical protein